MINTIIFDKDGVILDLVATWLPVAEKMTELLDEYTDGRYGADFFQHIIGIDAKTNTIDHGGVFAAGSFHDQKIAILEKAPELAPHLEMGTEYQTRMRQFVDLNYERPVTAKGAVKPTLETLRADGYKLAILTNDAEFSARKSSTELDIIDLFDMVVGFDSGYGGKPQPEGYLAICEALNTTPDASIMIGDTHADVGVAKAAGARHFIGVSALYPERTTPLSNITHIMPDISHLPHILTQLD